MDMPPHTGPLPEFERWPVPYGPKPKRSFNPCALALILGCGAISIVLVALTVLRAAGIYNTYYIPSKAMAPALQPGDMILTSTLPYLRHKPQRGDIVVFVYPDRDKSHPKVDYIKRIVGLPGETVEIRDGKVLINGTALSEPYTSEPVFTDFAPRA